MADLLTALSKAVIARFESDQTGGSAYALTGGRFYNHEGPQNAAFPYITFFVVSNDHDLVLGPKDFDTARVQLSTFTDDRGSASNLYTIMGQLKTLFDEVATLDFSGTSNDFTAVMVKREPETYTKTEDVWQGTIDYLITCQEA